MDIFSAESFLRERYGIAGGVEYVGEGAWSRCFGFQLDGRSLVVRFGRLLDDFEKDRAASEWRSNDLPIPDLLEIGDAFDGFFAVSTHAFGVPLESLDATGWAAVTPSLLRALDALRRVPTDGSFGAGDFGRFATWREFLLSVATDSPTRRTFGWSERLHESESAARAFQHGLDRLDVVTKTLEIQPSVIHSDLVNRNVLVLDHHLSGVFDWGYAFTGDFLYEIATIVFWTPWYDALGEYDLLGAAVAHYRRAGADLDDLATRLEACALHVGLVHIAYNAFLRDWPMLERTAERMETYVGLASRISD